MSASCAVILVESTSHAIRIEKLFNQQQISCKLIPVPRQFGSDCGVCVRVNQEDLVRVNRLFIENHIAHEGIELL